MTNCISHCSKLAHFCNLKNKFVAHTVAYAKLDFEGGPILTVHFQSKSIGLAIFCFILAQVGQRREKARCPSVRQLTSILIDIGRDLCPAPTKGPPFPFNGPCHKSLKKTFFCPNPKKPSIEMFTNQSRPSDKV